MAQNRDGPNWKKIKADYVKGGISQEKLAAKHGVSYATLRRRAERENWRELKAERERKVAEKLPEKIADIQADTAAKLLRMQDEAVLVIYGKLLETLKNFPNGVGTKNVRETVDVKKLTINGEEKEFPLRKVFTNDLEAVVRSLTALARLYGLDAASKHAQERFDFQKQQGGGDDDTEAFNDRMLSLAELIRHPLPDRTMDDVEAPMPEDQQEGETDG